MSEQEPPGDVDPGDPLPEIAALTEPASAGLLARVRDGIQRRVATAQWLDFSITMFLKFLQEVGAAVFGLLGRREEEESTHE